MRAARRSPSELGSTPTMKRGSMTPLRRLSLNIRSVPMFPGPTIAAVAVVLPLLVILAFPVAGEPGRHGAQPREPRREGVTGGDRHHRAHGARENHVAGLQGHAARTHR